MPKVVTLEMIKQREADLEKKKRDLDSIELTCMCCCHEKPPTEFYKSSKSLMWNYSAHRVLFCKDCIDELFKNSKDKYDEPTALKYICALLDIAFLPELYQSVMAKKGEFSFGHYIRTLNGTQYTRQTLLTSIVDGEWGRSDDDVAEVRETRWSRTDIQNKKYAIAVCGYDPFDDVNLLEDDRRYCFNVLAGYCDADGIKEDNHKIQCVIEMSLLNLQCRKLNQMINQALLLEVPDEKQIKALTETKTRLTASVSKLAEDNNISSKFNSKSKQGANTLSMKIREMSEMGYEDSYVNMFDIRTSQAMQQIAELSNTAIMESLSWDANDYTEIVKEQRGLIITLQDATARLEEENRLLHNQIEEQNG